jgi:hypothetical protein
LTGLSVLALAEIAVSRDDDESRKKVKIEQVEELGSYRMARPAAIEAVAKDVRSDRLTNLDIKHLVIYTPGTCFQTTICIDSASEAQLPMKASSG